MKMDVNESEYLHHLNVMNAQLRQNDLRRAYQSLLEAADGCPASDTGTRDTIANFFLNFAGQFDASGKHHEALSALQFARDMSALATQACDEMAAYLTKYIETEQDMKRHLVLRGEAKERGDIGAVASATMAAGQFQNLNKNRLNPLTLRMKGYIDYPSFVHLETIAVCNAACTFCTYPEIERQGTRMPDELIEKVIQDLSEVPATVPFTIAPYKVSDPFLEKRLVDIIRQIDERLPSASVTLITNGAAMTEKTLRQLAALKNVQYIRVSLNDHRKDEYEKLMAIPFDRTLDRLDMLHRLVENDDFPHPIFLNRVMDGQLIDVEFRDYCKGRYPKFRSSLSVRNDWIGGVSEQTTMPSVPDVACCRWTNMSIVATGDVALCCMDGHAQWSIGNVRENSVLDIYNSPSFRKLREHTPSRLNAPDPCRGCTYI